jgi:hypothetical protein
MLIKWNNPDDRSEIKVPAKPETGIWTLVRTFVTGPQTLRLGARGRWRPISGFDDCTADGLRHWVFGRDLLLTRKAPLGALIGKIGGSNIGTDDADIFAVGSVAILNIDKIAGPLYLTINDAPAFFDDNTGEIDVTIG